MFEEHFEYVLDLEDLAHPGWTQIREVLLFTLGIVVCITMKGFTSASTVNSHDINRRSLSECLNLVTIISFILRYLEIYCLLMSCFWTAARHLHFLQESVKRLEMASLWFTAAQLSVKVHFVVLDTITILTVITVDLHANKFSRIELILRKSDFTTGLRGAERHKSSNFANDLQSIVLWHNFLRRLVDVDSTTTTEG